MLTQRVSQRISGWSFLFTAWSGLRCGGGAGCALRPNMILSFREIRLRRLLAPWGWSGQRVGRLILGWRVTGSGYGVLCSVARGMLCVKHRGWSQGCRFWPPRRRCTMGSRAKNANAAGEKNETLIPSVHGTAVWAKLFFLAAFVAKSFFVVFTPQNRAYRRLLLKLGLAR